MDLRSCWSVLPAWTFWPVFYISFDKVLLAAVIESLTLLQEAAELAFELEKLPEICISYILSLLNLL